jgi:hypothetical protein
MLVYPCCFVLMWSESPPSSVDVNLRFSFACTQQNLHAWTSVEDELENKCRQRRQPITSPLTGLELPTTNLMPLVAVQKAIEAYMAHRPQLKSQQSAKRSFAAMPGTIELLRACFERSRMWPRGMQLSSWPLRARWRYM